MRAGQILSADSEVGAKRGGELTAGLKGQNRRSAIVFSNPQILNRIKEGYQWLMCALARTYLVIVSRDFADSEYYVNVNRKEAFFPFY